MSPATSAAPLQDDAVIDDLDERDPAAYQQWHDILSGDISLAPGSRIGRAAFRHLPVADPRGREREQGLASGPWAQAPAVGNAPKTD